MIIIDFIKRQKSKKLLKEKILQHKKNMLKVFFDFLQTPESDSLAEDSNKLNMVWYKMLDFADELYEPEMFEMFRVWYFPINDKECKKGICNFDKDFLKLLNIHNWNSGDQIYKKYLKEKIKNIDRKEDLYEKEK